MCLCVCVYIYICVCVCVCVKLQGPQVVALALASCPKDCRTYLPRGSGGSGEAPQLRKSPCWSSKHKNAPRKYKLQLKNRELFLFLGFKCVSAEGLCQRSNTSPGSAAPIWLSLAPKNTTVPEPANGKERNGFDSGPMNNDWERCERGIPDRHEYGGRLTNSDSKHACAWLV